MEEKISAKDAMKELTLMLMYLSKITEEKDFKNAKDFYAWKTYDFETVDALADDGLVYQGKKSWKRVFLEEKGMEKAKSLLEKYGIADWQ